VNQFYDFYADVDGDGYGAGNAVSICAASATPAPAGYAVRNGDCNNAVAAINPGHTEVLYNGSDDNCDGQLDEGFQVKTQVLASECGTTLSSIGSLIRARTLPEASNNDITGYRFRVTNGASVQTIDKTVPHFALNELATFDYATTYTIEVELQKAGQWLGYYGTACQISTPAILAEGGAAQVSPSQCGITLPKINTLIATTSLPGVTGYRFRVTNVTPGASGAHVVQVLDRSLHWFSLTMLAQYNYGSTYTVEIAVKTNGAYSGYGSPCPVSSPAAPQLVNCGGVIARDNTLVFATSTNTVTQYRFQVTRISDGASTTIDRSLNWFMFNMIPAYTPGATYGVRVAVMSSGTWSPFGDACEITAPGAPAKNDTETLVPATAAAFKAVAYPNPFVSAFGVAVTTAGEQPVGVKVYDMLGKLIESREVKVSELGTLQVGDRYPSGVYNVIVTQGTEVRTLRVIKR
jgi:hypothetical protein